MSSFRILFLFLATIYGTNAWWYSREYIETMLNSFHQSERSHRSNNRRSPSYPFITGDGFRHKSDYICESIESCNEVEKRVGTMSPNQTFFIKSDFIDHFAKVIVPKISTNYRVITHNGDMSSPDGQADCPDLNFPIYQTSDTFDREWKQGKLISMHAQNTWWVGTPNTSKPEYLHCLPIGFENRMYKIGRNIQIYAHVLQAYSKSLASFSMEKKNKQPLLLVAFKPVSYSPDRKKVLQMLGAIDNQDNFINNSSSWYNVRHLDHSSWLKAIGEHRFVLAPFGHGLDTHRLSEILMMGGIPVSRRSSISSCYDDSDNTVGNKTRGSLPIIILNSWSELTEETLEREWFKISNTSSSNWDASRLFIHHWLERANL